LFDKEKNFKGIEIGAPSITSPNFIDTFGQFTDAIDKSSIESNKDLVWTNGKNKGYVELEIYSDYVDVKFKYVSSIKSKNYTNLEPISFRINHQKVLT
jgi:alkaline phosphatase D